MKKEHFTHFVSGGELGLYGNEKLLRDSTEAKVRDLLKEGYSREEIRKRFRSREKEILKKLREDGRYTNEEMVEMLMTLKTKHLTAEGYDKAEIKKILKEETIEDMVDSGILDKEDAEEIVAGKIKRGEEISRQVERMMNLSKEEIERSEIEPFKKAA